MCRLQDLRCKEVINVRDGIRYGYVCDVVLDPCTGKVHYIIVPGESKAFGLFGCDHEYVIPWHDIVKIGDDIVLVDVRTEECHRPCK